VRSKNRQYKHQLNYFDKEFAGNTKYTLDAWMITYIDRIKQNVLDKNFKKKTIIDIATGSGYAAIEMAKMGMQVIACDLSPQSIKNLHKYKKDLSLSNLKLFVCKAEEIPLKNKSVDYILANAILEHIPDERAAVEEWKRILKPNGKMFITVPLKYRYVFPFLWPIVYLYDKRIGHLRRYDLKSLQKVFKLKTIKYFYSGHLVKIIGLIINILMKTNKLDQYAERVDQEQERKRYGANNITVIFKNEK